MTVAQMRTIFAHLLRRPRPGYAAIARQVSAVLCRTEETRIYKWHARTGGYPPPRPGRESG